MKRAVRSAVCLLLVAFGTGTQGAGHTHGGFGPGRNVLSVDVYSTGDTIDLLTGETTAVNGAPALWYRRSTDGGKSWSTSVRVDAGMPAAHRPHRGNEPQVASSGGQVVAVWTSAGRGFHGLGSMVTALSNDGGRTWKRGPNPADDEGHNGHGYADLLAHDGRFHLTWLDSRSGTQGVRYARSGDGGASWSANATVSASSCECCWNTLLGGRDRPVYLLFRGKGPRDMGLAASADDGATWKITGAVGAFNWQIEACPHTGGALALTPDRASQRLNAIVWTGKTEQRGLHYFDSRDGGKTWGSHARLGGELAQRADLAARRDELVAVWDETVAGRGAVFLSRSKSAGTEWTKPMRLSADGASAIYPRVVSTRSNVLVLWTESAGNDTQLRMVLMK